MGLLEPVQTVRGLLNTFNSKKCFKQACSLLIASLVMLFSSEVIAADPVPSVSSNVTDKSFVGEQFCFDATFTNTGDTGYGPYLRLITKPDFSFSSATLLSLPVEAISVAGTLPGLVDPISGDTVTGSAGSSLTLLRLPIGSVVTGGVPLNVNTCIDLASTAVPDVIQSDAIQIVPAYEYGNTATGTNGPIIGVVESNPVMPEIIHFSEDWISPEDENPPGPEFTFPAHAIADIAANLTVSPVTFPTINIGSGRQFVGPVKITGGSGCTVTATSSTGQIQSGSAPFSPTHMTTPGGKIDVTCSSATGTPGNSTDVLVEFPAYIVDILNPLECTTESSPHVNIGKHVVIRKEVSTESSVPGTTLTFSLSFAVSEYATADYISIEDVLPDGYTYIATQSMTIGSSSYSISPVVDHNGANGQTKLTYDVSSVYGANFAPTTTGLITYTAVIDETYETTGQVIESNDSLTNTVELFYSLLNGAGSPGNYCIDNSVATVVIVPIRTSKTIVNPKAEYMPGEEVIFRLKMDIPSGDTRNIVFEDYFPLPVFDVTTINTSPNLGSNPDISIATGDTLGLTPSSINVDSGQNMLRINWPDVNTTSPQSIVVDVKARVSTVPFADNLFLTNLLGVSSENTLGTPTNLYAGINLHVRAPELSINKTANQATVDAGDTVGFDITIKNDGGAPAYDVVIKDTPQAGLTNCSALSSSTSGSVNGDGDYVIATLAANAQAVVSIQCDIEDGVEAGSILINDSSVDWASTTGGTSFPPEGSDVSIDVEKPVPSKVIVSTSETYTDDTLADLRPVAVGEIVRYKLKVELPEGHFTNLRIRDLLPSGLVFENDGSAKIAFVSTDGMMTTDIAALTGCATLNQTGDETTVDSITPNCAISPTSSSFGSGTDPIFSLSSTTGFVANTDDDTNKEYAVLELNARVLDITANVNGGNRRNKVRVQTATLLIDSVNAVSPRVKFVEPLLQLAKSTDKSSVDAGDTIAYTIDISHVTTGSMAQQSTANAHDVQIIDILPAGLSYVASTLASTCTGGLTPVLDDTDPSGTGFSFTLSELPLGESCELTYQATSLIGVMSDDQIKNTANLSWGSLPGDGTSPNPTGTVPLAGNERSYAKASTATVEVNDPIPVKSIASTDQTHTAESTADTMIDPRPVSIGEIIRYRLVTQIAEGTATNVVIKDQLPDGLKFIDSTATFALISNGTGISSSLVCNGGAGSLNISGDETTVDSITPDCGITANAASFGSGTDAEINLGNLVNQDSDADKEYIVLEFDAVVLNETGNQSGQSLSNTFNAEINGTTYSDSNAVVAKVVEPKVDLSATVISTGVDSARFTLVFENTGAATAFQIGEEGNGLWKFELPDGLRDISAVAVSLTGAVTENGNTTPVQSSDLVVGGADNEWLSFTKLLQIEPGAKLEITFDAQQIPAVIPVASSSKIVVEYATQQSGDDTSGIRTGADLTVGEGNSPINSTAALNDYRDELTLELYQISGSVFDDADVDGLFDSSESGLTGVTVVLFDGSTCQSIRTDADGKYGFFPVQPGSYTVYEAANESEPVPASCPPIAKDLASYISVTANTRAVTVVSSNLTDINFADIREPTFSPDHSSEVLPGNVVFYTHEFTAKTKGTVNLSSANTGTASAGWTSTLYQDVNCNGKLDSGELSSSAPASLVLTANEKVCLVNKVFAHAGASAGETYINTITADFDYGNSSVSNTVLKVTDVAKPSANDSEGTSRLELRKTVENLSQATAETETQNQAKPGDLLKYRIYYSNTGTEPLTDLKINDSVPTYTIINGAPVCDAPLPIGITSCVPAINGDAINWVFPVNDELQGGQGGSVSYQVTVE